MNKKLSDYKNIYFVNDNGVHRLYEQLVNDKKSKFYQFDKNDECVNTFLGKPIECWCNIENYPNYMVSNYGNVKNIKTGKILKIFVRCSQKYIQKKGGYKRYSVQLFNKSIGQKYYIHQLVAKAFLPIPKYNPDGTKLDLSTLQVNHKDCDTSNNKLSNLEWVDAAYNNRAREQAKPIKCIETNEIFQCAYYAAEKYNIPIKLLYKAANSNDKKHQTAAGFHWTYDLNL